MRKHSNRPQRRAAAPMLVVMQTIPDLGITEHLSVIAFRNGTATTDHFDNLADCRDILTMAATKQQDQSTLVACEVAYHALISIQERHTRTGRFGATGEELKALVLLAETSEDFWKRQSGTLFADHYLKLKAARRAAETQVTS